jgi:hypothetical protein
LSLQLKALDRCFHGIVPSIISTCGRDGEPNVTYLSQIQYLDEKRVALSCQFFNKTKRNVQENPFATIVFYDPVTFEAYRLRARFDHAETSGALFDTMAMRIQVIASHTGMAGVFRLISADVYEVLSLEKLDGFLEPEQPGAAPAEVPTGGPLTELRGLQAVSERIARATDLDSLLVGSLTTLDELLGFSHSMVLVHEETCGRVVTIASRGYGAQGIGAEVKLGDGLIGAVAQNRRMMRVSGVRQELHYGRVIRERVSASGEGARLAAEIPLAGLPDAQAQLALPLVAGERLVGVLAVESRDPLCFDEWDEAFLQIVANQIALGIDRMQSEDGEAEAGEPARAAEPQPKPASGKRRTFVFYKNDDCVFVDDEYLVRNVPGKILWKLLRMQKEQGRSEFSNRELRLDPWLGLPPLKDNLESRLILLRKRLVEKCPDVALVPVSRGRFKLRMECSAELVER